MPKAAPTIKEPAIPSRTSRLKIKAAVSKISGAACGHSSSKATLTAKKARPPIALKVKAR